MHQTTATIHAIFLVLALLASQSWGYFVVPQLEETPIAQQSDAEKGEEEKSLLELSVPTAPEKRPEVHTASPKNPKNSSKVLAFLKSTTPVWKVVTRCNLSLIATINSAFRLSNLGSGYPHSHGNRGPPLLHI